MLGREGDVQSGPSNEATLKQADKKIIFLSRFPKFKKNGHMESRRMYEKNHTT